MARVKFEDGTVINFEGQPTPQDIEEAYNQAKGIKTTDTSIVESPKKTIGDVFFGGAKEAGRKTYTEAISPMLSGLSTAALGLPKTVASKFGVKDIIFPEQETLGGKAFRGISEATGFTAGAPLKIGAKVAGKMLPKIASEASLGAAKGARAFLTKQAVRNAVKMGIEGGVGGAILTPEKDFISLPQRGLAGVAGFLLGTLGGAVAEKTKGLVKSYRKFVKRHPKELPSEEKELFQILPSEKKVRYQIGETKSKYGKQQDIIQEKFKQEQNLLKQNTKEATSVLEDNKKILIDRLKSDAQKGALTFQEDLPAFYKNQTDAYGDILDDISEKIVNESGGLDIMKVNSMLKSAQQRAEAQGIGGAAKDRIDELLATKYSLEIDKAGNIKAEKTIPFKDVLNDFRSVFSSISKAAIKGGKRFSTQDIPASYLKNEWGKFIATQIPEFGVLQKSYSQIVDAMDMSNSIFQPFKGELYTEKGAKFLETFGMKKPDVDDYATRLIAKTQEGSEKLGAGIGDKTGELVTTGKAIRAIDDRISKMRLDTETKLAQNTSLAQSEKNSIMKTMEKRLGQLRIRQLKAEQVNLNTRAIVAILKTIGWTGGIISGGYATGRVVGELAQIGRRE